MPKIVYNKSTEAEVSYSRACGETVITVSLQDTVQGSIPCSPTDQLQNPLYEYKLRRAFLRVTTQPAVRLYEFPRYRKHT